MPPALPVPPSPAPPPAPTYTVSTSPGVTLIDAVTRAPLPPLPRPAFLPPPPPSAITVMDTTRAGTVTWTAPPPEGVQMYVDPAATDPVQLGTAAAGVTERAGRPAATTTTVRAAAKRRWGRTADLHDEAPHPADALHVSVRSAVGSSRRLAEDAPSPTVDLMAGPGEIPRSVPSPQPRWGILGAWRALGSSLSTTTPSRSRR